MKLAHKFATLAFFASIASISAAQFTTSGAGPYSTAGDEGDAGNGIMTNTYTGTSAVFNTFSFTGTLNSQVLGTWEADATWGIHNTSMPSDIYLTPLQGETYTSSTANFSTPGLFWVNQNDNFTFEAFDTFDDGAGADANWTNVNFTYSGPASFMNLGTFASGSSFLFDTESSDFDTTIALYSSTGLLLGTDDDGGTDLLSMLDAGALADGTYYFTVGGFESLFIDGNAIGGEEFGDLNVNLNGSSVFAGTHDTFTLTSFTFTVANPVPEPASMAVLGLGAAALLRRRKRS